MSTKDHIVCVFSADFNQDLENARVMIEDSPWKDNPQKYRKVAEDILRRILSMDPNNESANLLLAKATAPAPRAKAKPPVPVVKVEAPPRLLKEEARVPEAAKAKPPVPVVKVEAPLRLLKEEARVPEAAPRPPVSRPVAQSDLPFVVQTIGPPVAKVEQADPRPPWVLIYFAAVGAIAGVLLPVTYWNTLAPQHPVKTPIVSPVIVSPVVVQASTGVSGGNAASSPGLTVAATATRSPSAIPDPVPSLEAAAAPRILVAKSNIPSVAPVQTGTLAVSSPTTVDIYRGDQLVGSAPTSLVLPVGNQTLEYRHQDQRKVVTHVIKAKETTTTMITFEVPIQINARPWAQVFIDGPQRQPLGQTPLSDVQVPIGTVLIFENPNFSGKSYRVTGRETAIRVTFP